MDKSTNIVKKLKLIGSPYKIFKNTAFIKGMFNTSLECAKFEGAAIKTVSGIRGQIKRGLSSPEGSFRATFEDKILASDIVFLSTWYTVDVPRYYNIVTNLLSEDKGEWKGMRTVGQIRYEQGLKVPVKKDSLYRKVERKPRKFNPLKIPRGLEKELPFKSHPKLQEKLKKKKGMKIRKAVILEPGEKRARALMQRLSTLHKEKMRKRKERHKTELLKHLKKKREEEKKREEGTRLLRKKFYQEVGLAEKRKIKKRH
jgi:ribosome biogenesis protein BMS1